MRGAPWRVAGVDGCRRGWVVATASTEPTEPTPGGPTGGGMPLLVEATVEVVTAFATVVARWGAGQVDLIGVDMPIGLPDAGSRACDRLARARLGPRRSSVFPAPPRAALGAGDYDEALRRCRAIDGVGLSRQSFHLLPRLAEVDAELTPDRQDAVFESHPESVFAVLAGAPLATTKRSAEGREARVALLTPLVPDAARLSEARLPGARPDDVLDALAVAVAAARRATGLAEVLGDGSRDARGLEMTITV